MKAIQSSLLRTAGLLAGASLVLVSTRAAEADAFPVFTENYIKVSGAGASLNGSKAAYQARSQTSKAGTGGIEDFNYTYDLSKDTNLVVDGRVMANDDDYLLQFKLTKNEFGSVEVGYKRFRTFYDGAGGFFPTNNLFMAVYRRPLFVDRGKFFVNATIAMPKAPVFTFKYANENRTGRKASTIWGDTDQTGIPIYVGTGAVNPISADRKIIPAYNQLNERNQTWELSMRHTVANSTAVVTVGGDRIKNRDVRSIDRYLGELRPYPYFTFATPTLVSNAMTQNPNRGTDIQGFSEKGLFGSARIETVLTDTVTTFAGFSIRHSTQSIDASRLLSVPIVTATGVQTLLAAYTNGGRPPYSYTSRGSMKQDLINGNIGVQLKPIPTFTAELALKAERLKDSGDNNATYQSTNVVLATGASTPVVVNTPQAFDNVEKPWTPAIDIRYTGIRNVALYGSWEYRSAKQDERVSYGALNVSTSGATSGQLTPSVTPYSDHIKEKHSNIKVGANWTPMSLVTLRAEVFSKDHENRFTGYDTSLGSYYILNYDIYGTKLSAIVKPLPAVSFTTRYLLQRGKSAVAEDGFQKGDSNDARRHQLSETVDWNPNKNVYVQANASVVYDNTATAYKYVTGTARDVIRNAKNDYYNGDVTVGFAYDKTTDVQLQGTYYHANNFDVAQAYSTLPLGASATEYTVTAGVKAKVTDKTILGAKVGFLDTKNGTLGGYGDYRGPMAYVTLEHAF